MKMNFQSLRWRIPLRIISALSMLVAVYMISPTSLEAGQLEPGHAWHRWFGPESTVAKSSPPSLRTRLAGALEDADRTRKRIDRLSEELLRVRRTAEDQRDIIFAGCLLPHEKRARQLAGVSTNAYNALLAGLTEEDAGKISHNLEIFAVLEQLEAQVKDNRDLCRGKDTVVYVEEGPHLPIPPPRAKPKAPRMTAEKGASSAARSSVPVAQNASSW